jgi:hypothetical protein
LLAIDNLSDSDAARFIFDESHYAQTTGRVKPRAVEPSRHDNSTSVFLTDGLAEPDIWKLGDDHVVPLRGKPILARANLTRADITEAGLSLHIDNTPPRHANIRGWPTEKDQRKLRAQELASFATLTLRT